MLLLLVLSSLMLLPVVEGLMGFHFSLVMHSSFCCPFCVVLGKILESLAAK